MLSVNEFLDRLWQRCQKSWIKVTMFLLGLGSLMWFLIRVIPKPSRVTYPCQRAAFPVASAFVIWLLGILGSMFALKSLKKLFSKYKWTFSILSFISFIVLIGWIFISPLNIRESWGAVASSNPFEPASGFDWKPGEPNKPIGIARGIFPGRVVMTRDPLSTSWEGNWSKSQDQWWLDKNTDTKRVQHMLSVTIKKLTETKNDNKAWENIFKYYNKNSRGLQNRGYQKNEIVAIKINLNNSSDNKTDNLIDASPQMVYAMVHQLVYHAHVPEDKIIVYDARRTIAPAILKKIWTEFKDVRFVQERAATKNQPVNPAYGNHQGIEEADWTIGLDYSAGNFNEARQIPRQIIEATYLINLAILKTHSYPYNYMEDRGSGETGVTLNAKNHFGSIKAPWELHGVINPAREAKSNNYSPLVDMASSPNLGAKTILFVLDGLYGGRKWHSYPIHFPNPPFNNKDTPYENSEWPACVLTSLDQVALESVGIDILYAQSKGNNEPTYHNVPRIMFRDYTDDYLLEMASPENAPSGTRYIQNGKEVKSLGVHEHWDDDQTMRYSRNLDPENGTGIEFIYIPVKN